MKPGLFGQQLTKSHTNRLEGVMRRYDKRTFSNRLLRLEHVTKIFPRGLMHMLPPESAFVFEEAKMSFINDQQDPYHAPAPDAAAALGLMHQIAITKI